MEFNSSDYCVYHHLIGDEVFYVGSGIISRAFDKVSRNEIWKDRTHYAKKYKLGFTIKIVQTFPRGWGKHRARKLEKTEILRLNPIANIIGTKYIDRKTRAEYQPQLLRTPLKII